MNKNNSEQNNIENNENRSEYFKKFQNVVFGNRASDSKPVQAQVFERNLRMVRYVALVIIAISIYWLIVDSLRGGALRLTTGMGLAAIILQMVFSIYMLVLPFITKNKSGKLVRYSFLAYYICLITTVCILGVTKNIVSVESGNYSSSSGIPLSTYYLLILVLSPLPSKRDSIILGIYFVILQILPLFLPGHEAYNMPAFAILGICMIIAYIYVRNVNVALSDSMQRLSELSFTDPLTSVLNRRSLDAYLDDIINREKVETVGILIFDIDDFKKYNDHYTHSAGDAILRKVCEIAEKELDAEKSGFMFRYGGEEFVVLLIDHTAEEIIEVGQRIRIAIYDEFIPREDGSTFDRITITVGGAFETIDASASNRDYISSADKQLYIGKSDGKNCVVFGDKVYR